MVYLVRQGQTDWNKFRKFNGRTETELNQTGIAQAEQQAKNLQDVSFDACFCSPQKRARQTCEIIFKGAIAYNERLIEIDCGEFEGQDETLEAMKLIWRAAITGDKGTEPMKDFIKRNCDFCDTVAQDYKGKNVLIVTHAANARIVNYYFSGKPKDYDFVKGVVPAGGLLTFEN